VNVTSDLSPAVQRFGGRSILKLSAKNVDRFADWERCAKEFACDSSLKAACVSSVAGKCVKPWRKTLTTRQTANALRNQPKAKKRLASSLADEVLPSKLCGKCCV